MYNAENMQKIKSMKQIEDFVSELIRNLDYATDDYRWVSDMQSNLKKLGLKEIERQSRDNEYYFYILNNAENLAGMVREHKAYLKETENKLVDVYDNIQPNKVMLEHLLKKLSDCYSHPERVQDMRGIDKSINTLKYLLENINQPLNKINAKKKIQFIKILHQSVLFYSNLYYSYMSKTFEIEHNRNQYKQNMAIELAKWDKAEQQISKKDKSSDLSNLLSQLDIDMKKNDLSQYDIAKIWVMVLIDVISKIQQYLLNKEKTYTIKTPAIQLVDFEYWLKCDKMVFTKNAMRASMTFFNEITSEVIEKSIKAMQLLKEKSGNAEDALAVIPVKKYKFNHETCCHWFYKYSHKFIPIDSGISIYNCTPKSYKQIIDSGVPVYVREALFSSLMRLLPHDTKNTFYALSQNWTRETFNTLDNDLFYKLVFTGRYLGSKNPKMELVCSKAVRKYKSQVLRQMAHDLIAEKKKIKEEITDLYNIVLQNYDMLNPSQALIDQARSFVR